MEATRKTQLITASIFIATAFAAVDVYKVIIGQ